jgi:hypothetical protein
MPYNKTLTLTSTVREVRENIQPRFCCIDLAIARSTQKVLGWIFSSTALTLGQQVILLYGFLYGFAESWILIGRRAVRKMRIRTVVRIFPYPDRLQFPYVNLTGSNLEPFLHVYKIVMSRKSILGSFLRIRSLGSINKYLYQHNTNFIEKAKKTSRLNSYWQP